jgi:hypothetical protein
MRLRVGSPFVVCAALCLWTALVGVGFFGLVNYDMTPGSWGESPARWPADSSVVPDASRANLVLAAHPHCPCTRATLDELEQILTRCQGKVTAHVVFYKPPDFAQGWERTALWRHAAALPGTHVWCDEDGVEARRFGCATSGHALLYHADGRLLFSGGITNGRGHAGESSGRKAIVALLQHGMATETETAVFGCPLTGPCPFEGGESCNN